MVTLAKAKLDIAAANDTGRWFETFPGWRWKLRHAGCPAFVAQFSAALAEHGDRFSGGERDTWSEDTRTLYSSIQAAVMASELVIDWDGLTDDAGDPIPFSVDMAQSLFTDPAYAHVYTAVSGFVVDRVAFCGSSVDGYVGN